MQKLLNDPRTFAAEVVDAVALAYPDRLRRLPDGLGLVAAGAREGKVAIVTGGGSGHLPLFLGYVGEGLLDGVAVGDVFASPSAALIADVAREVDAGAGVLFLYGNYGGDVMNFDLAGELLAAEGIKTATVRGTDDVASAAAERKSARRGIAGLSLLFKVAGACAAGGADLDQVVAVTRAASSRLASMGVALSPTILPLRGEPTFQLPAGQMEIGMGIHGEPGVAREPLQRAEEVGARLAREILDDLRPPAGAEFAVLVNGLGATPREELFLLYASVHRTLAERGHRVWRAYVGEYATSLDMGGASVSLLQVDGELKDLLLAPSAAPVLQPW
ncbi:dihydroxyacetone kinase subunit DhaK [Streptomyces sp. NPDC002088]|uniref:dihydroxyacetone kinase subunit DhaK n=1 Tax=unclassified Streptomyces TaxID=2593676 RepID=UPI00332CDD2A